MHVTTGFSGCGTTSRRSPFGYVVSEIPLAASTVVGGPSSGRATRAPRVASAREKRTDAKGRRDVIGRVSESRASAGAKGRRTGRDAARESVVVATGRGTAR